MPRAEEPTNQEPVTHVRHVTAKKSVKASVTAVSTAVTVRSQARKRRGRKHKSLSYTPTYRRRRVEEYLRLRERAVPQEKAAHRAGDHALKTLRNWAEELGIDFI